jgi:cell division protein FtsA
MSERVSKMPFVALFDLGHGTCRLVVLAPDLSFIGAYSRPMEGFQKGKVVDATAFSTTIRLLVADANLTKLGYRAVVNVPEIHTRNVLKTVRHRSSGVYRSADYNALIDATIDSTGGDLDEVIDTLVLSASLDDKALDPLAFGTPGRDVQVRLMLATHPKLILADIVAGLNAGGVEIAEFRSNGLGLARGLRALRPSADNAVLLDIGQGTTTGCLVVGGGLHQIFSFSAGSQHISRDLAVGLGCEFAEAEHLKISHGLNGPSSLASTDAGFRNVQQMGRFLRPRISEILAMSAKHFAMFSRALDGGLLLCGNGSNLLGLSAHAIKQLGVDAPFICQLSQSSVTAFVGVTLKLGSATIDSGWLSTLAHVRCLAAEIAARRVESDARPLSKLRPLWTWLSELSR